MRHLQQFFIGKTKQRPFDRQYDHLVLPVFTEKTLKYRERNATLIRNIVFQMSTVVA